MSPGGIFVTGTDTGVGKTVVSAALTLGLGASYWKPVQAGVTPSTDTESVREWTGLPPSRFLPEAYRLRDAASPHAASAAEGVTIRLDRILDVPRPSDRMLVVEGAGGLLVPLNHRSLIADLILALGYPAVLVARTSLGTLNHTLLSIAELRRRGIPLLGVILSGDRHDSNEAAIRTYAGVEVLGRIPFLASKDPGTLASAFRRLRIPPIREGGDA